MAVQRFYYFMALLGCFLMYGAVGSWLSWVMLMGILALPWLSLLLSLPAIWGFRAAPTGAEILNMGEEGTLWLLGSSRMPMPPFRGRLRIRELLSGRQFRYQQEDGLPTAHCGGCRISVEKCRVCDYLGLFAFRPRILEEKTIIIRPAEIPVPIPEELQLMAARWHPKSGGGFSEQHEIRDFRPGDAMNGVHWKLSAKTGSLLVREPVEPEQGRLVLTVDILGTPEELDRKFGRLLWLGRQLLEQQLNFEIRALTGSGLLTLRVTDSSSLNHSLDTLLCQPAAEHGSAEDRSVNASWQYHIGGEPDEA